MGEALGCAGSPATSSNLFGDPGGRRRGCAYGGRHRYDNPLTDGCTWHFDPRSAEFVLVIRGFVYGTMFASRICMNHLHCGCAVLSLGLSLTLGCNSGNSATQLLPAKPATPNAPTDLTAEGVSTSRIELTWKDNADNERDFRIERRRSGSGAWIEIAKVSRNTTAYADRGLVSGRSFDYRVRAFDRKLNSAYSNVASGETESGASCTYTISPNSVDIAAAGSVGQIAVIAPDGCNWTATEALDWISLSPGATGNGRGTLSYEVAQNQSTSMRIGTITIADRSFTLSQAGAQSPCDPCEPSPSDPPRPSDAPSADAIPLDILEPVERNSTIENYPVSVGLVFPEGELTSTRGRVVDDLNQTIAFEAEVTGMWQPERTSIKWLLLKFRASTDRHYYFEPGSEPYTPQGKLMATTEGDRIIISTGPLEVAMAPGVNRLFEQVTLRGQPMLKGLNSSHVLVRDHGGVAVLSNLRVAIEENTPARATIRATGRYVEANQEPVAQLDVRVYFFRDESFVRVVHTLTWMIQDPEEGLTELYLGLTPQVDAQWFKLGLSDYERQSTDIAVSLSDQVEAFQDTPVRFSVLKNRQSVGAGTQLGGWMSVEDSTGRGLGVSLKHAWQTFPTSFAMEDGQLRVKFWPARAVPMRFTPNDIMPDDFFYLEEYWQSKFDSPHYVHEFGNNPAFLHTAEGAARTHELTIFFYDEVSTRTTAELNSLNQHPVVVRQDPKFALKVPIMGFSLAAADPVLNPNIEAAVDNIGAMATVRFANLHDYGFWRFGFARWGEPGTSLKRWFDGLQYDNQMTPWILYMRGGGRKWYEEGEIMARFGMDVATNHYNTRGAPTGYQSQAAGMPFPWKAKHEAKQTRIHFLAYYYHLTGDLRAKDVMHEVIEGTKAYVLARPTARRNANRTAYNMNRFWANAYEETGDEVIKHLAREWLAITLGREFDSLSRLFNDPEIYLYDGLIAQYRLWERHGWGPVIWDPDNEGWDGSPSQESWTLDDMKQLMLANLTTLGFPATTSQVEKSIARMWAYEQTGDLRYLESGWAIAQSRANMASATTSPLAPGDVLRGNTLFRIYLMPILSNTALPDPRL